MEPMGQQALREPQATMELQDLKGYKDPSAQQARQELTESMVLQVQQEIMALPVRKARSDQQVR